MATDGFTPARERARRVRIAEALRGGSMASPVWLLCPDAALRQELQQVAEQGAGQGPLLSPSSHCSVFCP